MAGLFGEGGEWLQSLIMLAMLVFVIYTLLSQVSEMSRRTGQARAVKALVECGGARREVDFQEGYYVGKVVGSCDDGSPMRVVGIYVVKPEGKGGGG